jgi:hypothetical protein
MYNEDQQIADKDENTDYIYFVTRGHVAETMFLGYN